MIDFRLLGELALPLAGGAAFSVLFTLAVCVLGGLAALAVSFLAVNATAPVRSMIALLSLFFRGFPLLVLLYLVYYGLGSLSLVRHTALWTAFSSPLFCALLAFTLNHAFFVAQILTGALRNISPGIVEAASALGLHRTVIFATVQLPLAWRLALPAYRNEVVMYFKSSSLVTVVTLTDLLSVAKSSVDQYFDPITPFVGAACLYWLLVQLIQLAFDRIDRRLGYYTL
ncbi:MAG: ABC transporter permease subunit [Parvibaculaceae bacterium]